MHDLAMIGAENGAWNLESRTSFVFSYRASNQRTNSTMRLFSSVGSIVLVGGFAVVVDAFPTSTGSCDAGTDAILKPGFSHATNAQVGTGPLSDAGISVTLNDEPLVPDTPTDFSTLTEYNLTITSDGTKPFTGFLARIEGNGEDPFLSTIEALAPYDGLSQVAVGTCVAVNRVGGVSHTNADPKLSVSNKLSMDVPAPELLLDITVVIRCNDMQNVSEWYYSRYELNAVAAPSMAPTTRFPPSAPTPTAAGGEPEPAPTSSGNGASAGVFAMVVIFIGAAVISVL